MARRETDLIQAMDHRARMAIDEDRRQSTLEIGRVKQVTLAGASVQLSESGRFLRTVQAIQGVDLVVGASVICARIGRLGWRIIGAIEAENAITPTFSNTNPVAQPQNVTCTSRAGHCAIEWDASYFLIQCYEVQINASAVESGATTVITDNTQYDYYDYPGTYYTRIRAVGESYDRGSWTDWTEAVVGEPSTFLDLRDTPASYSGEGGKFVQVADTEDGLEFTDLPETFLEFTDTPSSYSGQGLKGLRVNAAEDAVEFEDRLNQQALWAIEGSVPLASSPLRIYNVTGEDKEITRVFLAIDEAPVGDDLIVDVNLDGTTIFTNQAHRAQISDGAYTGETTDIDVSTWDADSYLTVDVDQIGSSTAGSDMTVHVVYRRKD